MNPTGLAQRIDHTALPPETTPDDADRLVEEALRLGFAGVCVHGRLIERVRRGLEQGAAGMPQGTPRPRACAVAGFPLGAMAPMALAMEATLAAKAGAEEIDAVAWLPHLLGVRTPGDVERSAIALRDDLLPMVRAVRAADAGIAVKVILETAALRAACQTGDIGSGAFPSADARFEAMLEAGCRGARESGCDFVKTSTGFHPAGDASVDAVRLLRKHAGALKVKASGGIRTREDALRMLDAGADRIGTSAGVAIVSGAADAPARNRASY